MGLFKKAKEKYQKYREDAPLRAAEARFKRERDEKNRIESLKRQAEIEKQNAKIRKQRLKARPKYRFGKQSNVRQSAREFGSSNLFGGFVSANEDRPKKKKGNGGIFDGL